MSDTVLDEFGKILIEQVRDKAIDRYSGIANGSARAPALRILSNKLSSFSDKELSVIEEIVIESIDSVIFNFLNMLEQKEDKLKILCIDDNDIEYNIAHESDGLAGEMFTEDGWIYRFSRHLNP